MNVQKAITGDGLFDSHEHWADGFERADQFVKYVLLGDRANLGAIAVEQRSLS